MAKIQYTCMYCGKVSFKIIETEKNNRIERIKCESCKKGVK